MIISYIIRSKPFLIATLAFLLINASLFISFFIPQERKTYDTEVVFYSANVQRDNSQYGLLIQDIHTNNPDVIILSEVDDIWMTALILALDAYPYGVTLPRSDFSGIALLSKYPLISPRIEYIGGNIPSVVAELERNNKTITVIGEHPLPPFSKRSAERRDSQLRATGTFVNRQKNPTVLIGDLNTTAFGHAYRHLIGRTQLRSCSNGFGYQSTWQRGVLLPPFGLKIDHCLHTPGISIIEHRLGGDIGSDHHPIVTTISF